MTASSLALVAVLASIASVILLVASVVLEGRCRGLRKDNVELRRRIVFLQTELKNLKVEIQKRDLTDAEALSDFNVDRVLDHLKPNNGDG